MKTTRFFLKSFTLLAIPLLMGLFFFSNISVAEAAAIPCVRFESLTLGETYSVGDSFIESGASVSAVPFVFASGVTTFDGVATVEEGGLAGGSGHEMEVNNIALRYTFGQPLVEVAFSFGEYGGNLNLTINGEFQNFDNFEDIDGTTIGSVDVSVTNGAGDDTGIVRLSGIIQSFSVGGQELWIDNVCPADDCIDFDDLIPSTSYSVGDSFVSRGVPITVEPFVWADGTIFGGGSATVQPVGFSGGKLLEMNVNNSTLNFQLPSEWKKGLSMHFGEYGGNLNLEVNGAFINFDNFNDLDGTTLGGVTIKVINGFGSDRGKLFLYGAVTSFKVGGQELYIDEVCPIDCCIDYESVALGSSFVVGDSFFDAIALMRVQPFTWASGTVTAAGTVNIGGAGFAGHAGHEANLNNATLGFDFGGIIPGLSLHFGEYGGNLNITINGDFHNFDNFADIDGMTIGGADIKVVNGFGNDRGILVVEGDINSFSLGGQELYIDHVCVLEVDTPDVPSAVSLTTMQSESRQPFSMELAFPLLILIALTGVEVRRRK